MDWCIIWEDNELMICVYQYENSGTHESNLIKIPYSKIKEKIKELNLAELLN